MTNCCGTGEKPYACHLCNAKFTQKPSLNRNNASAWMKEAIQMWDLWCTLQQFMKEKTFQIVGAEAEIVYPTNEIARGCNPCQIN